MYTKTVLRSPEKSVYGPFQNPKARPLLLFSMGKGLRMQPLALAENGVARVKEAPNEGPGRRPGYVGMP
jgi:hypothetical protein